MKKGWLLLLILSLGLNLGLGVALLAGRGAVTDQSGAGKDSRRGFLAGSLPDSAGWRQFARRRADRLAERLQLDPDQKRRFDDLHARTMPLIVERRREVERARQDFHDACRSAAADPDSLRRLVKRLTLAQGRLDSLVTESLLRELETLTPEQRDRYLEAMPWSAHGRGRFPSPDRGQARHRGADPHR